VLKGIDSGESFRWIHLQQLLHKVNGPRRSLAQIPLVDRVKGVYFREFHTEEALVFEEGFIVIGCEWAETLLDEEELVELIFSWEHRIAIDELSENATHCPHIDLLPVTCTH
jgi:hypothetical protein